MSKAKPRQTKRPPSQYKRQPAKMGGLTARQRSFALEYFLCGVAIKAALAAGYSPGGARSQANRLVQNEAVMTLVRRHEEKAEAKKAVALIYDAAWVAKEQAKVAAAAYAAEDFSAATKALRGVGDAVGIYVEKREVSGPGGAPLQVATLDVASMTDAQLQALIAAEEKPMLTLGGGNGKKNVKKPE